LETLAANFYHDLFTAQGHTTPEEVVRFVPTKVTSAMNELLDAPFTVEEVRKALFMMKPNKMLSVFKPLDLHGRYPQQGRRWGSP
jgi:hypothetical protein